MVTEIATMEQLKQFIGQLPLQKFMPTKEKELNDCLKLFQEGRTELLDELEDQYIPQEYQQTFLAFRKKLEVQKHSDFRQ